MNPPKDYAPHKTLAELEQDRMARAAWLDRWTTAGLWFASGLVIGSILMGLFMQWYCARML